MSKIYSMTGFALLSHPYGNGITCELRSLNSRFLEISIKTPIVLKDLEDSIKELIQKRIQRGRVTCTITFNSTDQSLENLKIDSTIVNQYKSLLNQIREIAEINEEVKLEHLLAFKDIISFEEDTSVDENLEKSIFELVEKTTSKLDEMRNIEGKNLSKDIRIRLDSIKNNLKKIEPSSKKNAKIEFDKLYKRLLSLIDEQKIDKNRLENELAIISDRVDVTEEITRLNSHIDLFEQNLKGGSPVGKKLNFLLQEMHREANTISSKSTLLEISHLVISIKEEIERIREQIQNIE
jgi:uncharacterized protein (TIGR00255 family)